jgi:hypothetical protein
MTPEEQNAVPVQQQSSSHLQRKLAAWRQRKDEIDTQYSNKQSAQMESDTVSLYEN